LSWLLHVQHQWTQFLDRYGRFFPQAQRKQDVLFLYWYCSEARLDMLEAGTVTPAEILRVAKEVGRLSELPTGDDGPFLSWLINDRERIERLVTHLKPAALEKLTSQKEVMFAMKQLEDAVWRRESLLETEAHTPTNPG
jgi:hypothetical protein